MSFAPGPSEQAAASNAIPNEYYFITAPQNVEWDKNSKSNEIATYGTNTPYLSYGSTSLRKLKLGNAMVEGFSDGKEVEGNITSLERCMEMIIDSSGGYTSPYCWHVFAGAKSYGTYIIKSVSVDEKMRDMSGKATRAFVDLELQEVSSLQVSSGTDITSKPVVSGITQESYDALNPPTEAQSQDSKVLGAKTPFGSQSDVLNPGTAPVSNPAQSNEVTNQALLGNSRTSSSDRFGARYTAETGRGVFN